MALVQFPNAASEPPAEPEDADTDWSSDDDQSGGKMSFLDHLDELRKRIIRSVLFLLGGFLICATFVQQLFDFIMRPMQALLPPGQKLVYTEPSEAFVLYIQVAALAGLLLASPGIMAQVWLFIAPGLYQHEKKVAIPFVLMSSSFFIMGAAFGHYVVFPMTWKFFVGFSSDYVAFMPRIEPAFGMYLKLLLGMGLVFQMPTLVLFLARMGVLTAGFMLKHFKYAFLAIFIIAAVVTPGGDPMSQTALAAPMVVLYLFSILLAWLFGKKKASAAEID